MNDPIYEVYWEGPYEWDGRHEVAEPHHVLYSIHGTHAVYGVGVPLYIGKTERAGGERMDEHNWWVTDECDSVALRLASLGSFSSWAALKQRRKYRKARSSLVTLVEALLIYSNQPAYNSAGIQSLKITKHFRLFNSGNFGRLVGEASTRYFDD